MCWSIEVSLIAALYGYTASLVLYRRGVSSAPLRLLLCVRATKASVGHGRASPNDLGLADIIH